MEERSSQSTSAGPLTLLADAAVQVQVVRHDDGTDSTHQLDCGVVGAAKRKAAEEVAGTGRHEEKVHQVADHQPHCWVRLWTGHPSGIIELGICVHQPPTNLAMSAFKWQLPIAGAQKKTSWSPFDPHLFQAHLARPICFVPESPAWRSRRR